MPIKCCKINKQSTEKDQLCPAGAEEWIRKCSVKQKILISRKGEKINAQSH